MGYNDLSDYEILDIIERARRNSEFGISYKSNFEIQRALKDNLTSNFARYNNNSNPYYFETGDINLKETITNHNYSKSVVGTGMFLIGSPILKKRFVTHGTVKGTSIASKYLSKALPQQMSFKIYSINANFKLVSTKGLGRGLGRLIPNVGAALIIIDVVQLLIEIYELDKKNDKVTFKGFGNGGSFGGGGSSGYW
ncbi:hypothetical protein [uncultured Apibacter sp.]|uniref:hypothetical protein n=1 Tax=uncultured Apibacter sp. TaxID=1778616 RepID=UPI0025E688FF|nr:hypothetical protein [uncultured Apibacter sp.]